MCFEKWTKSIVAIARSTICTSTAVASYDWSEIIIFFCLVIYHIYTNMGLHSTLGRDRTSCESASDRHAKVPNGNITAISFYSRCSIVHETLLKILFFNQLRWKLVKIHPKFIVTKWLNLKCDRQNIYKSSFRNTKKLFFHYFRKLIECCLFFFFAWNWNLFCFCEVEICSRLFQNGC